MFKCVEHGDVVAAGTKAEAEQQDGGVVREEDGGAGRRCLGALGSNACDSSIEKYVVLLIFQPRG